MVEMFDRKLAELLGDGLNVFGIKPTRSFGFRLQKQDKVNSINLYLTLENIR